MRLICPYCGERDHSEFSYRGDGAPQRPPLRTRARNETAPLPPDAALIDYVYVRNNPRGAIQELWQHVGGCRAWLRVDRDVTTHAIGAIVAARAIDTREDAR